MGQVTTYQRTDVAYPDLVTQTINPLGTAAAGYDADGRQIYARDAGGNVASEDYSLNGQKCWQALSDQSANTTPGHCPTADGGCDAGI